MFTKTPEKEAGDNKRSLQERSSDPARAFGDRLAPAPSMAAKPSLAPVRPGAGGSSYGKTVPSIIGEDLIVVGNVSSNGEIQVDGEIQGDIHCVSLLLGDRSRVTGAVVADDVVVRGTVMGSIHGLRVTLQAQSHVEGDIYHQSLAIEQGAYFEGKSRRSEDPVGDAKASLSKPAPKTDMGAKPVGLPHSDDLSAPLDLSTPATSSETKADAAE